MNYEVVALNLRYALKKYIVDNGLKSLVIGVSGGIDSALCCALAYPVCKELNIPLIGRSITIETNKADEISRAQMIGDLFCMDFKAIELTEEYLLLSKTVVQPRSEKETDTEYKIRRGNVKARLRMVHLYDLAQQNKGLVLSTDNYTELMVGFWTLHGDVGDYGMFQNLWKTEVYDLSRWLCEHELDGARDKALMACVNATPTDGLGITNSDLDQLGAKTYSEVDSILQEYFVELKNKWSERVSELEQHPVVKRYNRTHFKRENPYNIPRDVVLRGAV